MPAPLSMALGDNGDAVEAHDAQERDYAQAYGRSAVTRWRLRLKEMREPIEPALLRQLLGGMAVLSALAMWRLNRQSR